MRERVCGGELTVAVAYARSPVWGPRECLMCTSGGGGHTARVGVPHTNDGWNGTLVIKLAMGLQRPIKPGHPFRGLPARQGWETAESMEQPKIPYAPYGGYAGQTVPLDAQSQEADSGQGGVTNATRPLNLEHPHHLFGASSTWRRIRPVRWAVCVRASIGAGLPGITSA